MLGIRNAKVKTLLDERRQLYVILVVALLMTFFAEYTVPFEFSARGYVPLGDALRDKVSLSSINGVVQTIFDDQHGDVDQFMQEYTVSRTGEGILIQPLRSNVQGCSTDYTNYLVVNFTIFNELPRPQKATLNVSVYDTANGQLAASKLIVANLEPKQESSYEAKFYIISTEYDPIFLVKVTFPTADQLAYVPSTTNEIPLFQYLLIQLGLLSPEVPEHPVHGPHW